MALQARAQATRETIIQSAMDLFEDAGYSTTGLVDILARADVTKGAFYYHFPTKEAVAQAIVSAAYERTHQLVEQTLGAPTSPALENLIRTTFVVAERIRSDQMVRVGHQLRLSLPALRTVELASFTTRRAVFVNTVEAAIAHGDVLDDVDPGEVADTVRAVMVGNHALLDSAGDAVFTGLASAWRVVLRGIVAPESLPYFGGFVTRMAEQYMDASAAQAR